VEAQVTSQRKLVADKNALVRKLTQAQQELELELMQTQQDRDSLDDQIAAAEATIAKVTSEVRCLLCFDLPRLQSGTHRVTVLSHHAVVPQYGVFGGVDTELACLAPQL
jgi:hypothetical protein